MTAPPVLIGFDLATQVGWCAGDGSRLPVVDSFVLPSTGSNVGRYLLDARAYFRILLDRFQPSLVIMEAPIRTNRTDGTTIKLHGLGCVLEMECEERGIEPKQVYPVTSKKRLAGHGHAKKPAMILAARNLGLPVKNADEADAVGAWLCGVEHYSEHWPAWAERLRRAEDGFLD